MLLCVDPDDGARDATRNALVAAGFDVGDAASFEEGTAILEGSTGVDCIVTEQVLPDGTGLELLQVARRTTPDTAGILFTEVSLDDIDTAAFGDVVAEYLRKDSRHAHEELVALVEHSLAFRSQTAYPVPDDEDARLAALDRYAVTPEALGESIDRLTELATELFGLDSAGVGLIDAHEEQFLSCHGASFDIVDREASICTYAILDDDVMVVEDVPADPRFADDGGLAAAGIEFYAGTPLVTPDGHNIGVFCLHDDEPRSFAERDQRLLRLLADEAMDQLTLRRELLETTGGETDA